MVSSILNVSRAHFYNCSYYQTNGWARTVLRNGISLLNGWPMVWDETTEVSFKSYPDPPQGDLWLFGANYGRLQLRFPNGAEKFLEAGNPPVDFTGYEQYLPKNYFTFDHLDVWSNTSSDMWDGTPLLGAYVLYSSSPCKVNLVA